jgi:hypothetical protein
MFSLGERGPQTLMGAESGLINSPIRRKDAPGYSGPQVVFHLQQCKLTSVSCAHAAGDDHGREGIYSDANRDIGPTEAEAGRMTSAASASAGIKRGHHSRCPLPVRR